MLRFVLRRLAVMPLLLLGVVTVAFVLSHAVSNPLAAIVGERNLDNPEVVAAAEERWGLDKSLPEQYVVYLGNLAQGDMGTSFRTKAGVSSDLSSRLPATLELATFALLLSILLGIVLGVVAARNRGKAVDGGIRVFALAGSSLPVFWVGLIFLFIFYATLGIAPGPGRLSPRVEPPPHRTGFYTLDSLLAGNLPLFEDALRHLVMPGFIMSLALLGTIIRIVRSQMLEEQAADYVRTARAKGMTMNQVWNRHVLKNSITPVVTIVGVSIGMLIMGAVLIETIFSWNGIGTYAVESSRSLDFPAITGVCLVGGIIFLVSNLLADVAYAVVDPRVRLS
ncbi:ABC-type dipeptide/oligopeptide/nickel transport system permease component [Nocardioides zeae]|uniref:ABC-type dipeptide/oligopeptide/nickel transport system permease component n=1 Tax=Nocardioides zeae TaxID=1457234 RepID=A0ACC6IEC7_9ACTN|nr:ABC transporter permease [Nocardioides zeae]MDR6174181.1 ABC-type dipeptide/oligopeptide/nickel transport system permease component [Nocardioides zeae]MDR6208988.1 ABC-type dipeptide/oligopeptide/nickel transport system permease component [Nocardioides zeae]